jgi:subtilisin family serine protease
MENDFWRRFANEGMELSPVAKLVGMRLSVPILLAAGLVVGSGPRWLRFPDKGPREPTKGSRAWQDAPMREDLLDSLRRIGWKIRSQYKWENMVSAEEPSNGSRLPAGVVDAGPVAVAHRPATPVLVAPRAAPRTANVDEYTILLARIWAKLGIDEAQKYLVKPGRGITIAFMDGYFQPGHPVLSGANIADAYDFVDPGDSPWDATGKADLHGTQTSGLVASPWSLLPGIAPYARFLLYRTENDTSETSAEEDNLAAAFVRADSMGAQVISTSLGYRYATLNDDSVLHPWSDFDGRTLVASRAAATAARRGIVVVVAAGNEASIVGGRSIGSPADADSILTVGAVDTAGARCGFSSWGPTYDGRIKPDVVAAGCYDPIAGPGPGYRTYGSGTSFATPLVAGMAVLARQLAPGLTGQEIVEAFRSSGTLANHPDSTMGWGVPNLLKMYGLRKSALSPLRLFRSASGTGWMLKFEASSALTDSHLGVELRDSQGRLLFRWEGRWLAGKSWTPALPRGTGILVANWWGDFGQGASKFLVAP